jgi:hypothetical protein
VFNVDRSAEKEKKREGRERDEKRPTIETIDRML